MTIAALHAAVDGFILANTVQTDEPPSTEECLAVLAEELAAGRA